ncbi:hypothetical protein M3Y99_00878900 [Aphelenchoides fujianensis]|nr:hypothetical protein M3Y99_00878900 [Aphelenchoides fujianensis]
MAVEPIAQLAQKYRTEFEQQFDGLRQRTSQLADQAKEKANQLQEQAKDLQPLAMQKKDELAQVVADQSPVDGLKTDRVLETYAWTAVLQFTYSLHIQLPGADDLTIRFKLLAFAAVEGLLVGFLLSDRYLTTGGPLTFLTPLVIGLVAQLAEGKLGSSRQTFLGATVGSSLALHLVLGLLGGQLSFAYLLLAVLYTALGLVTLQLYLKHQLADQRPRTGISSPTSSAPWSLKALIYALFGGSYEDQKAAAASNSE